MRTLKIERRLQLYKAMLALMIKMEQDTKEPYALGFCFALNIVKSSHEPSMFQNLSKYPELQHYKPAVRLSSLKHTGYWFERATPQGAETRKRILREIISQMEKDITYGTM